MSNAENRKRYLRKRVIEIIDAYLFDPKEEYAKIKMVFKKANGEEQRKTLLFFSDKTSDFSQLKVTSYDSVYEEDIEDE